MIHIGNCLEVMAGMEAESVDAIVTDPPYGLAFMGKKWDYDVPSVEVWAECLRVLKPGGHLLAFAGTRTQHRMAVRIEDAGFEIRDMIAWVYGSGFPKSLDVSKAIDKAAGAEREVVGQGTSGKTAIWNEAGEMGEFNITAPATEAAKQWEGWGTALKPAMEPITVARKPLGEKTVAANVLRHGTGAINVDGCRVGTEERPHIERRNDPALDGAVYGTGINGSRSLGTFSAGRWPANLLHDGSDEVVGLTGDAARFFYCAKASKKDREEGLDGFAKKASGMVSNTSGQHMTRRDEGYEIPQRSNNHPTVKPTDLMRYLCRLVTPPGGIVLDPFCGSGSTGKAAIMERFRFSGIEKEAEYAAIAQARIEAARPLEPLFHA